MSKKHGHSSSLEESGNPRAGELFLDTIGFVIDNIREERQDSKNRNKKEWKTTVSSLQLVSLEACRAWRDSTQVHLKVTEVTPSWLWKKDASGTGAYASTHGGAASNSATKKDDPRGGLVSKTRVPKMRVTRMTWERDSQDLTTISFPPHLKQLVFHWGFDQPIDDINLPEGLQEIEFSGIFNRPLPAKLPQTIRKITFGLKFNQPLRGIQWPSSLRQLIFGHSFDQKIDFEGALPALLKSLHFGQNFQQSLRHVQWPDGLEELSLSSSFSESLREVVLPQGLRCLTLTGNYPGQLDAVQCWPSNLTTINLNGDFNQPIASVVWPTTLQKLSFGWFFNQTTSDVAWPLSLTELSFGGSFAQPVESVVLPNCLESLAFLQNSSQTIEGMMLPESLKNLSVGRGSLTEGFCTRPGVKVVFYEFYSLTESL